MGTSRTAARQPAPLERKPAPPVPSRAPAAAVTPVQLLQRRLGNQGAAAYVAKSALRVSSPSDPAEREAVAKAAEVIRMPAPVMHVAAGESAGVQRCACEQCSCASAIQRQEAGPSPAPDLSADIATGMSGGSPLPRGVRTFMEPRFGADFSGVRIHTGEHAARLSTDLNAHAFTVGNHIFFGKGQFQPEAPSGRELIAHELTHTIQQGASVERRPAETLVHREEQKKSWWESLTDWGESFAWDMVREVAPHAVPILQKGPSGVLDWIGEKISSAADAAFNAAMAPVRDIAGIGETLSALFGPMVVALQTAAGQIAHNDCSPIREAADKIEKTAEKIITPIVEKLQPVVAKVKAFLNDLWDKIGAPIWSWIKQYAKEQWESIEWLGGVIKSFYTWIWEKTSWIRAIAAKAWTWVKNKLGIGEGPEGQDGLLQWVQGKVEAAWNALKAKIAPFQKELTAIAATVGAVLLAISPAGPVLAIAGAVAGAVQGFRWIAANWGKGDAIVQARAYLEKALIPALMGAAKKLSDAVAHAAQSITSALVSLSAGLNRAVGSLGGSILRFLVSAVQWLADQAAALSTWAATRLADLARWLIDAVEKLLAFLKQILHLLGRLGGVILDIYGLPLMLGEKVWNWIPACVRDPIVDFLGPIILRQIELFSELGKDSKAWQQTKADVMNLIHLVFKDHDLVGAVKAAFHLVLRVFNVPMELLTTIWQKALSAWDLVSKKPLEFIKNTVRAIGQGFKLLKDNFKEHLEYGLQGWLFGELAEKKITPPASWTDPKAVFGFVLDVLGLSVEHVYELLKKRFDPAKVDAVRKRLGQVVGVIAWVNKAIDTTKSPAENARGMIDQAKDFGKEVLTGIAEWVTAKVLEELAVLAAAAAASGGLSEILDIIRRVYKVLVSIKRYLARILNMVNETLDSVIDLATGKWEPVGAKFEKILHRGMPVVIGFLAEQVGLGGIGQAMRDIVDKLREKVDAAILWLIDKIKAGLDWLIGLVKAGVQKLTEWWKKQIPLDAGDVKHTLRFEGADEAAYLVVNPETKRLRVFVQEFLTVEGTEAQIAQAEEWDDKISATQKAIVAAEKAQDQAQVDALSATLDSQLRDLGAILLTLMSGSDEGSEKHPAIIDYPKRRAEAYPDIYIGPRVGEGVRVNQDWLREAYGKPSDDAKKVLLEEKPALSKNDEFKKWKGPVRKLSPTGSASVDGDTVGLDPQFASLAPGVVLVYSDPGSTGGGHKINDIFKPYGFVPSSRGGEGLDGDHVFERQLGGPDIIPNLWPLDRSENRSSGSLVKSLKFFSGKNLTVSALTIHELYEKRHRKKLYLLIRSVRSE
ncbi:MAG TPA: DUF4157 domain-containing protein [Bryobacteraceae bacterium]|nr:DUF4157 domain-containing protein [Bryobacteraceae bacterium]